MNGFVFAGLLTALLAASGGSRQRPQSPVPAGAYVAGLIWLIVTPSWLVEIVLLLEALERGDYREALLALVMFAATSVILFPGPITRLWLIPRGRPRLAWAVSRLSFWTWRRDVRGGALIAASWAAVRRAQRDGALAPELQRFLEARLGAEPRGTVRWRLGGASIIAAGLLAEARGDRAGAQRLLASAGELAEATWPRRAITLAWEWLCAEAMTRGAWREVEFLARTALVDSRSLAWFGAVAARLTGIAPVPNDMLLRWRWFAAPQRLAMMPLLERGLAAPATARESELVRDQGSPPPPVPEGQPLLAALTLHAHALSQPPRALGRAELIDLAKAWDAALEPPELGDALDARGEQLGAHLGARSPTALGETVRDDLLALVQAAGFELGELEDQSEILGRAARRLHTELLDGLELSAGALESRVDARSELPALDEWQAFLNLREQYAETVSLGGLGARRLAFLAVHRPVCGLAVWLWNERSERAIGNAMFQWLLAEAIVVDNAEAIRLQEKNVGCGL